MAISSSSSSTNSSSNSDNDSDHVFRLPVELYRGNNSRDGQVEMTFVVLCVKRCIAELGRSELLPKTVVVA